MTALRDLYPARLARPSAADDDGAWLLLFAAGRLAATLIGFALVAWAGFRELDSILLLYGPLSTLVFLTRPAIRRSPAAWAVDFTATLAFVIVSEDWRSPFYLLWLASLALPATRLTLRQAVWVGAAAAVTYFAVALIGGPVPGRLQLVSNETLAIHVSLPFMLVVALAYAAEALRRLSAERSARERLAIEAERKRIAFELHDSAKQRLHAAHLLVTSLQGRVPEANERVIARAAVELESAASDMDTSLAELRSPLEGRRLDQALRARAEEVSSDHGPRIVVDGEAPELPPLIGAHAYRITTEALTNALRHADATTIAIALERADGDLRVTVRDDGRGLPEQARPGATGLIAMENRAATIGARLTFATSDAGTVIELDVPLDHNGGTP
ncbi:signal transduction histidine kinase [Solirubrobacter pauli]|uniref:histidine kinase n=1 Tax=Solirubrobacter pauli TaxID=166793 RepID=A0A660LJ78_9ACTN|nr:ATP-binding protein [Solirubrobacter pauli]RKQ93274.1 signal transduction histidine kinase [Solirubrobacter pauli]